MRAVQLQGFEGIASLKVVEVERPRPGPGEALIAVRAAGLNFAELEQTRGRYPLGRPLPSVMGFEAAGVVVDVGEGVRDLARGARVTGLAKSGGFAEYATIDAGAAIPIPDTLTFAEATTLTIQGLSALALLELAARPRPDETLLVQSAAGGVGLYLVQLAKRMGVRRVIALVGSRDKVELVKRLGAEVVVSHGEPGWVEAVREATGGRGVDVVLESSSGEVRQRSLELLAPFGRAVVYGAGNMYDELSSAQMTRLIVNNQSLRFFNVPTQRPEALGALVPKLLELVARREVAIVADTTFPLAEAPLAFAALASRRTSGKVVLVP